jgi:hypothetical protein
MLEEYVLSDHVSDDVGENLIPPSEEVPPEDVPFQPKPTSTVAPAPRGDFEESQTTLPKAAGGDYDVHGMETVILDQARRPTVKPPLGRMPPPPPKKPRVQQPIDDFDEALHNAPTMIIDANRLGRRR